MTDMLLKPEAVCWDANRYFDNMKSCGAVLMAADENRIDVFSVSTDTQLIHIYAGSCIIFVFFLMLTSDNRYTQQ